MWCSQAAYLVGMKEESKNMGQDPTIPFKDMPPVSEDPPTMSYLLKLTLPPNGAKSPIAWGQKL
jgi:hypothetical protein